YRTHQSLSFVFSVATQVRVTQARRMAQKLRGHLFDHPSTVFSLSSNQAWKYRRFVQTSSRPCHRLCEPPPPRSSRRTTSESFKAAMN
ncbi:unnamed protein product, partial [Sphacelaria rigidula]